MKIAASLIYILSLSMAQGAVLSYWDSFNSLKAANSDVILSVDKFGASNATWDSTAGTVTMSTTGRAWIDLSSLNMNLSTGSYSFVMDVSNLTLGNGPVFSLANKAYNSQVTAFGFATAGNQWAFSNNGGSMNVKGSVGNFSTQYSGKLIVNFLTEENAQGQKVNYVEAFLGNDILVEKTAITYQNNSAADNLTGLTLGGWGSTSNFGSGFTLHSLSINSVPEPATASLSLLGLASLLLRRRKA